MLQFDAVDESGRRYIFDRSLMEDGVRLTLKNSDLPEGIRTLTLLSSLSEARAGDEGYYVLPRNIDMNGDVLVRFREREDTEVSWNRAIMCWYGIKKKDLCCIVRFRRTRHFRIVTGVKDGLYTAAVRFDYRENCDKVYTLNEPPYEDTVMEVIFLPAGATYADMAKKEREIRLARGEIIPLTEKCRRPAVEYARKYPLIRIRMGWKPSPSPVKHQTPETEPDMFVACSYDRVCEIADCLSSLGTEGAELQLVGWNRSGHDGRFPQLLPPDPRLGGEEGLKNCIAHVKSLGYRISLHTNLIDAYEIADTFTPDDLVVMRNGEKMQCGDYSGGYAYHVCPLRQQKNAMRDFPAIAAFGENGLHFTDVISIVQPDPCCSPDHPCTTEEGVAAAQKTMAYVRGLFGGFSSEGAMDFAVRDVDFALYTTFGDGFGHKQNPMCDRYLPLFQLTYHGTLLYNPSSPTVNYPVKSPADRLTFYMHGGRPAFYFHSKFRTGGQKNWMGEDDLTCESPEAIRKSCEIIARGAAEYLPLARLQTEYMTDYLFVTDTLQCAVYADGTRMVGNFSDLPAQFEGRTVAPFGFLVL